MEVIKEKILEKDSVIIGTEINELNATGNVDTYKILHNAKLLELSALNTTAKVSIIWHCYKSKEAFISGKQPTFEQVEIVEFPKEFVFELINNFYALQAETVQ